MIEFKKLLKNIPLYAMLVITGVSNLYASDSDKNKGKLSIFKKSKCYFYHNRWACGTEKKLENAIKSCKADINEENFIRIKNCAKGYLQKRFPKVKIQAHCILNSTDLSDKKCYIENEKEVFDEWDLFFKIFNSMKNQKEMRQFINLYLLGGFGTLIRDNNENNNVNNRTLGIEFDLMVNNSIKNLDGFIDAYKKYKAYYSKQGDKKKEHIKMLDKALNFYFGYITISSDGEKVHHDGLSLLIKIKDFMQSLKQGIQIINKIEKTKNDKNINERTFMLQKYKNILVEFKKIYFKILPFMYELQLDSLGTGFFNKYGRWYVNGIGFKGHAVYNILSPLVALERIAFEYVYMGKFFNKGLSDQSEFSEISRFKNKEIENFLKKKNVLQKHIEVYKNTQKPSLNNISWE